MDTRTAPEAVEGPSPPLRPAHVVTSDAEALAIARRLAEDFRTEAPLRDRDRRLRWRHD